MGDLEQWTERANAALREAVNKATRLAEREPEGSPIRNLARKLHAIYDVGPSDRCPFCDCEKIVLVTPLGGQGIVGWGGRCKRCRRHWVVDAMDAHEVLG